MVLRSNVLTRSFIFDRVPFISFSLTKFKIYFMFRSALELVGLGNLSPNLIMLGFKDKWRQSPQEARDYVSLLQTALEMRLSVAILRVHGGLSTSADPFADSTAQESKYYTVTSIDNFNFSIEVPSSEPGDICLYKFI